MKYFTLFTLPLLLSCMNSKESNRIDFFPNEYVGNWRDVEGGDISYDELIIKPNSFKRKWHGIDRDTVTDWFPEDIYCIKEPVANSYLKLNYRSYFESFKLTGYNSETGKHDTLIIEYLTEESSPSIYCRIYESYTSPVLSPHPK